jgi:hypothetical protein
MYAVAPSRRVPFSKFDPYREDTGDPLQATTPAGARRARILRWVNWITLLYMVLGFGLIGYWLVKA